MQVVVYLLIETVAVLAAAYVLPGIAVDRLLTALVVAVVLAVLNFTVKPLLVVLTLPATILTLGLFLLVVNAAVVLIAAWLVPGFEVAGFWWAMLFSLVVSLVGGVMHALAGK
jgi:putative membrane protein